MSCSVFLLHIHYYLLITVAADLKPETTSFQSQMSKKSTTQPTCYSISNCLHSDSWVVKWWLKLFTAQIMSQSMWLTQPSFPTWLSNSQMKKSLLPCIVMMHVVQKALQIVRHVKGQIHDGKNSHGHYDKLWGKLITGWPFQWMTAYQEYSFFVR